MRKIAAVFAHPDDEAFGPGGTIYKLSQENEVKLFCVTNGDSFGNEALGQVRKQELINSAKILGVSDVIFLGHKDGSLCNNNYHEVFNKLKSELDKFKPDTILTYDMNGVSGHLDHIAVAMIASFLYEKLKYVKKIMYFCNDIFHKKLIGKKYFVYFPEGIRKEEADEITDCQPFWKTKLAAMNCHQSQKKDLRMILLFFRKYLKEEYFKVKKK
jgi:N-acetylglucosamine malate deacetylase 2